MQGQAPLVSPPLIYVCTRAVWVPVLRPVWGLGVHHLQPKVRCHSPLDSTDLPSHLPG